MSVLHDEIEIEDMEYDEDEQLYHYPCPCGDRFEIYKADLEMGEDIARCPSCSLIIRVIYDLDTFLQRTEDEKNTGVISDVFRNCTDFFIQVLASMSSVLEKKAEIDLIRSVFTSDELIFSDPSLIEELDLLASQNLPIEDKDIELTLKIAFPELAIIVDLSISLPIGYPQLPPSIILRVKQSESIVNEKALNTAFHEWLDDACGTAEPVICSVADWLRSALDEDHWDAYLGRDAFKVAKSSPPQPQLKSVTPMDCHPATSSKTLPKKGSQEAEVCYWIFSHHIRNPKKRKVIVDWARESNLTGCCLPGKPGTVVVEGPEDKVEEYWKRIRVLTWKRIQLKDREVITQRRFTNGFFEVGGTLAEKIGYMREHGISQERIAAHFGFKVDESSINAK
ncbi:unnamed protein product [Hydatigera taeniaeformis]|uniref:DPH-type MB domain-containing protein n=1 Tax=Hydatigena taeniaeformis TaxID=6205 RepID=A0A0R3X1D1_HYDTA|nr:unnamed protein product [Hydatigera taeniaeformis]